CGTGTIEGRPVVLAVLDFSFMGGSMGEVVGEKISLACDLARKQRKPLIVFTSSGGARMHEGMLSLMQMAKTSAALASLNESGGFAICVLTNPTTGGVTASFASVCDITLAEPGALIGFGGPRAIRGARTCAADRTARSDRELAARIRPCPIAVLFLTGPERCSRESVIASDDAPCAPARGDRPRRVRSRPLRADRRRDPTR